MLPAAAAAAAARAAPAHWLSSQAVQQQRSSSNAAAAAAAGTQHCGDTSIEETDNEGSPLMQQGHPLSSGMQQQRQQQAVSPQQQTTAAAAISSIDFFTNTKSQQQQTAAAAAANSSSSRSRSSSMSDFQLRETELVGGSTIDDVVDDVAAELGLTREAHLEIKLNLRRAFIRSIPALEDAVTDKKLCGIVHPYVADALANRLKSRSNHTFDFSAAPAAAATLNFLGLIFKSPAATATAEPTTAAAKQQQQQLEKRACSVCDRDAQPYPFQKRRYLRAQGGPHPRELQREARQYVPLEILNDLAAAAVAAAACTWAFDVDPEACRVSELKSRLEGPACSSSERMCLVFNGFTLAATNMLSDYEIQGGDSIYLYTLKDPEATTVVCCSSSCCNCSTGKPQHKAPPPCCCCCSSSIRPSPAAAVTCCSMPQHHTHVGAAAPRLCAAGAAAFEAAACCCSPDPGGPHYNMHAHRCLCGSCVATTVSPTRVHCNAAVDLTR
ncbi:hypothetical protein Esti_004030 [Eimeria stiedai]